MARRRLLGGTAAMLSLSACGGGGGINTAPAPPAAVVTPTPTPTPTPAPAPTPTPTVSFDTSEYRATVGAVNMNALAAYNAGATGAGVGIAIIDSGIDLDSAEFEGRVSSASQAFAGNSSVDDEGGHGTAVAFTAAGRRNGVATHGVAFGATVIALRADRPGTCTSGTTDDSESGCAFPSAAIAQGVDAARAAGARVINMSLGGSTMPQSLQDAIGRATAAGIVVVIAAGNDGTDNPDDFTSVAQTANARGAVIIAGSIGSEGAISSFSDKAGTGAAAYLAAIGERVRAPDNTGTAYLWSGTSFAAPQISAAVALLAQAFPNLTGQQIVTLLLSTARDAGAAGTDPIYGRGILDLTRAFQPVGAATLAGSTTSVGASNGRMGAAMGDAAPMAGAVMLDGLSRAFAVDLAHGLGRPGAARPLAALAGTARASGFSAAGTIVSVTLVPTRGGVGVDRTTVSPRDAIAARAIAGSVARRLGMGTSVAFGFRQGATGLAGQLAGADEPAFLVGDTAVDAVADAAGAFRVATGSVALTMAIESGGIRTARDGRPAGTAIWDHAAYSRVTFGAERRFGGLVLGAGATRLDERATLLGARLGAALGSPAATSWFADATARFDAGGWSLGGGWLQGRTRVRVHTIAGGGTLGTTAWRFDAGRAGLLGGDRLALRVSQPLRVAHGGLDLTLPTAWDYASGAVSAWTPQRLALAPHGRELDAEAVYAITLGGGRLETNLYWRRQPGNIAAAPADRGAALRWSTGW